MNSWITNWKKIKIKVKQIIKKRPVDQQETDWKNCPQCKKISYLPDLVANSYVCECSFHFDFPAKNRLDSLFDTGYEIIEIANNIDPDPLKFEVDERYKYSDKIKKYQKITQQKSALLCASGKISNLRAVAICFNPLFGGGRLGTVENEYFLAAANYAIQEKVDNILFLRCDYFQIPFRNETIDLAYSIDVVERGMVHDQKILNNKLLHIE